MSRVHATIVGPYAERTVRALTELGVGTYTYAQIAQQDVDTASRHKLTPARVALVMRPAYADKVWKPLQQLGLTFHNTPSRRGSPATVTVEAWTPVKPQTLDLPGVSVRIIVRRPTSAAPARVGIDAGALVAQGDDLRIALTALANRLRQVAAAIDDNLDHGTQEEKE